MPRQMLPFASRLVRVTCALRRCSGVAAAVTGAPVAGDAVPLHLRRARVTRVSIDANAGICRGMLRHRYDSPGLNEEEQQ